MIKILECLNNNSGAFLVLFSAIVAISTVVYAILTWKLVSETRKMREAQTEPEVCAYLQVRPGLTHVIQLVVHNIGLGPAHDVEYEINPILTQKTKDSIKPEKEKELLEIYPLINKVKYLPPNQKVFPLNILYSIGKPQVFEYFDISIAYFNHKNDLSKKSYQPNLKEFIDVDRIGENWFHKFAHELKSLNSILSGIKSEISSLKQK